MAIDTEEAKRQLAHYGVTGMHWGIRRSRSSVGSDGKSENTRSLERRLKKAHGEKTFATNAAKKYPLAKITKLVKEFKESDLEIKLIKSKYRDEYNKGKTAARRILTVLMGADKTYANLMYRMRDIKD